MKLIRTMTVAIASVFFLAAQALAEPALYEVSDDDTTLYLFGTVHLLDPNAQWRSEAISAALNASNAVYFEVDVYGASPQEMQDVVTRHGILQDGKTLDSILSRSEWQVVSTFSEGLGLPPVVLANMQPWLASITLTTFLSAGEGLSPNAGVDFSLYHSLNGTGVERRFFETVEEQIRFFADQPQDIQVRMLMQVVESGVDDLELIDEVIAAWQVGDLDLLDSLTNVPMIEEYPQIYDVIILRRNRAWAVELSRLMDEPGTYFVAVGAMHIPGDSGVVNLMEEEGYAVTRH